MSDDAARRALRQALRTSRLAHPPEACERDSVHIQARLLGHPGWHRARTVALYSPVRGEVRTGRLCAEALAAGKRVCFPQIVSGDRLLRFREAAADGTLSSTGAFGIPSPDGAEVPLEAIDLFVVPGLGFDVHGNRLGQGGGYYDVTLARARPGALRVGLCFSFQLRDALPCIATDVRMDLVVTEAAVHEPGAGSE
ncbi:MAG: 5-formyltetrahydrofolate cyclo-ligase [Myxococcales bacterium]